MSGKVIAMLQQKGGSQKTTTAINLTGALLSLGYKVILGDMEQSKPDASNWAKRGQDLKDHVIEIFESNPRPRIAKLKEEYDFIILDAPPNLAGEALTAVILSDFAIIPCSSSTLDKDALVTATEAAQIADKPFHFLASRIMKNTIAAKTLLKELEEVGTYFETEIATSVDIENSAITGQWVGSYKPNSKSHKQYLKLAKELVNVLGELK